MSLSLKAACVMLWYACSPRMIVEDRGSNHYQFGIYYFPAMHATKRIRPEHGSFRINVMFPIEATQLTSDCCWHEPPQRVGSLQGRYKCHFISLTRHDVSGECPPWLLIKKGLKIPKG
jgi:hypothetical protein